MPIALSIREPHITAILTGDKVWETRSWPTKYRGLLWLHASAFFNRKQMAETCRDFIWQQVATKWGWHRDSHCSINEWFEKWVPYGCIVGSVVLADCRPVEQITDISYEERLLGDFRSGRGRYGFLLTKLSILDKPIPYKGRQGLFTIKGDGR